MPKRGIPEPKAMNAKSLEKETIETAGSHSIQFLLAEFSELGENWKHTDSRIETAINFYITLGAIVLPGLVLLYQAMKDARLFVMASLPVAGALFVAGHFLALRITESDKRKAEYRFAMQLIRRYFVDRDVEIAPYLYMPSSEPLKSEEDRLRLKRIPVHFHRQLVLTVNVLNSFLIGISIVGLVWLIFGNVLMPIGIAAFGVAISVLSLVVLNWLYHKRIRWAV
jgi:hypothetical protein